MVGLSKKHQPPGLLKQIKGREPKRVESTPEDRIEKFMLQKHQGATREKGPLPSDSEAKSSDNDRPVEEARATSSRRKAIAGRPRLILPELSDEEDVELDRGHIHKTNFTKQGQKSNEKGPRTSRIDHPGQDHTGSQGHKSNAIQKRAKQASPSPEPKSKRLRRNSRTAGKEAEAATHVEVFGEEVMKEIEGTANGKKKTAVKTYKTATYQARAPTSSQEKKLGAFAKKFGQGAKPKRSNLQGVGSQSQASQDSVREESPIAEPRAFQSYGLDLSDSETDETPLARGKSRAHKSPNMANDFCSSPIKDESFKKVDDVPPSSSSVPPEVNTYSDMDDTPKGKQTFSLPDLTGSPTKRTIAKEDDPIPISLGPIIKPSQRTARSGSPLADLPTRPAARQTVCPWCQEQVEAQLLEAFSKGKGKRLNVNQQSRFCLKHKRATALEQWSEKGYPEIDWDELPHRIASYSEPLHGVILGDEPSHYRRLWAEKIEKGADRVLKKEENMNPGYYGPRGFNLFSDQLVPMFQSVLRERAPVDKVISGRGAVAFIQSVLLPELAVRLISDDMLVTLEESRQIMEDSKQLGELVHQDL